VGKRERKQHSDYVARKLDWMLWMNENASASIKVLFDDKCPDYQMNMAFSRNTRMPSFDHSVCVIQSSCVVSIKLTMEAPFQQITCGSKSYNTKLNCQVMIFKLRRIHVCTW
jgi:hypothetical protein